MKPDNFILQELVNPVIFHARGDAAWELLDPRAMGMLQKLRDKFGRCRVNDWHDGGGYRDSGLRSMNSGVGAVYSQHKFGRAFDCKFRDATPEEVFKYVLKNHAEFPYITVIENVEFTPTWFHFDTRNTQRADIWVVNP